MTVYQNYIKSLRAAGHLSFTTEEAVSRLNISRNALICGMYKLKKMGDIISPAKNLYVIIPPEHQSMGCLPAEELIPLLMRHWEQPYYVSLLSAALYQGASHQKPQTFQVIVNKQIKPISCGKIKIEFIYKKSIQDLPTIKIAVKTGYISVATAELTVMDLLLYPHHVGGINAIATVLTELIEKVDSNRLRLILERSDKRFWIQRLGYILEHIESDEEDKKEELLQLLHAHLSKHPLIPVALAPELPTVGKPKDNCWKVIENTDIESDI